jgi:hypothetical protein
MTSELRKLLSPFEILTIMSLCGLLFIVAQRSRPCAVVDPRNDLVCGRRADAPLRTAFRRRTDRSLPATSELTWATSDIGWTSNLPREAGLFFEDFRRTPTPRRASSLDSGPIGELWFVRAIHSGTGEKESARRFRHVRVGAFCSKTGDKADIERFRISAMCGRLGVGKDNLHVAALVGAAMCSACWCGSRDRWP